MNPPVQLPVTIYTISQNTERAKTKSKVLSFIIYNTIAKLLHLHEQNIRQYDHDRTHLSKIQNTIYNGEIISQTNTRRARTSAIPG